MYLSGSKKERERGGEQEEVKKLITVMLLAAALMVAVALPTAVAQGQEEDDGRVCIQSFPESLLCELGVSLPGGLQIPNIQLPPPVIPEVPGPPDNSNPGQQQEVSATGTLEKPEVTVYQYGTHAITDEASGTYYALQSEVVDLDAYVGQRVTVYGTLVPGYENGQVEGGPPLINVTRVEPAAQDAP
jgi:hypothetical protein